MQKIFFVIDPDASDNERMARILTKAVEGADVIRVGNAEAAIAEMEARRLVPSLIFCTLDLPGMSGLEFLAELRQHRWLERVQVAIVSDDAPDRQVLASYRLGACAFLTRPIQPHEVREAVRDFGVPAVTTNTGLVAQAEVLRRASHAA
jgi:DNA-binding response OmpR family regulator